MALALKEDGKTFDELRERVTLVNGLNPANRIEVIELSTGNDTIDAKGGNDVIKALSGNDTLSGGKGDDRLEGGVGNDTYIYNLGDGKDTIIDKPSLTTPQAILLTVTLIRVALSSLLVVQIL